MGDPLDYVDRININTKNFPPVTHVSSTNVQIKKLEKV